MEFRGTYAKIRLSDQSVIARGQRLPRTAWDSAQWLDPETNVINCPDEYKGFAWLPEYDSVPTLPVDSYYGTPAWDAPDMVNHRVVFATPVFAKVEVDLYNEQVARLAGMRFLAKQTFNTKVADGYEFSPGNRVGLHGDAFVSLEHAKKEMESGGDAFYARTSHDTQLYVSDAPTVGALLDAMRAKYLGFVKRENQIQDALDAAATLATSAEMKTALDAIYINAGWDS